MRPQSRRTRCRSLGVSSTAFIAPPSDLQCWPLMEMDFANGCPLVRPALPRIRFLFVGSRLCSTLPSDSPSRFCPCVSLVLHLHQVAQGTFTPKLSDMSDTQDAVRRLRRCRRLCGGILDCRCARRSAKRQVGTKGWSFPIEQRDTAIDLKTRQRTLDMTNLLNLTYTTPHTEFTVAQAGIKGVARRSLSARRGKPADPPRTAIRSSGSTRPHLRSINLNEVRN